jgi:hypothetical protein
VVCGVVGLDASGAVVLRRRRAHPNVAVVALANKLAGIAWAVLWRGETFAIKASPRSGVAVGRSGHEGAHRSIRFASGGSEVA